MSKKPFQLRLDNDQLDRLARVAAAMQLSKTEIVEAGIDMRLDLLEGYQKLDRGPPKGVPLKLQPGAVNFVDPPKLKTRRADKPVDVMAMAGARPIGWDADGKPIYRGK